MHLLECPKGLTKRATKRSLVNCMQTSNKKARANEEERRKLGVWTRGVNGGSKTKSRLGFTKEN